MAPTPPPPVVFDKDGKPVKAPKVCTRRTSRRWPRTVAEATKQVASLTKAAKVPASPLCLLRAQAAKAVGIKAKLLTGLATAADWAAAQLEQEGPSSSRRRRRRTASSAPGGGTRF